MVFARIIILSCLCVPAVYGQGPQLEFQSFTEDTMSVSENKNVSFTFRVNTSYCMGDRSKTCRLETTTKTRDGRTEYDGKVVFKNNTCRVTYNNTVRCVSQDGPAQLNRRVNSSHVEIVWSWTWIDCVSQEIKMNTRTIKLNVSSALETEKGNNSIFIIAIGSVLLISITIIIVTITFMFARRPVVRNTTSGSKESLLPTAVNSKNDSVLGPEFVVYFLESDLKKHWFQNTWVSEKRLMPMRSNEKVDA